MPDLEGVLCTGLFRRFLCSRTPLLLLFAHFALVSCRPESFPAYVSDTHGWVLKHTLYTVRTAKLGAQQDEGSTGTSDAASAAQAAPAVPAGGFQSRPIYVFQKPL